MCGNDSRDESEMLNTAYLSDALDVALDVAPKMTLEEMIMNNIISNNKITRNELAKIAGVSKKSIERKLKEMPNVKYVGTGRHGHWEVK